MLSLSVQYEKEIKMRKEINQRKMEERANEVTYTTKELIQGLHVKIDSINNKLNNYVCAQDCNRRRDTLKNMVIGCFGLLLTLIGGLASYIFFGSNK